MSSLASHTPAQLLLARILGVANGRQVNREIARRRFGRNAKIAVSRAKKKAA